MDWYNLPEPQTSWLIDGLFPSDSPSLVCGKPKAGKSTFIRNLIASVIKGRKFLGRSVDIPAGTARVLYIHLDYKDQPHTVAKELRQLGITEGEKDRIVLRTAEEIPPTSAERLEWLKKEADEAKPHLIVIDLMWDFLEAANQNDYLAVRNAVNTLQQVLKEAGYKGALVVTAHGRKATNPDDPADDICGSTGQRGSFSTIVMLARNRNKGIYTIFSEQTNRDEVYGEIEQTIISRNPDGTLDLGPKLSELIKKEKQAKAEESLQSVLSYIVHHPGCEITEIVNGLNMGKQSALDLIKESGIVRRTGRGVKGDPHKYFVDVMGDTTETAAQGWKVPISAAQAEASRFADSGGIGRPV
jgi:hypothetical protein